MSNTQIWFLDQLKNQGPSFVLMGVIVWFLYGEMKQQKTDIKQLQVEIQACNKSNQDLIINQLQKNTRMLELYEFNHDDTGSRRRRVPPINEFDNE
ncbi:MAG: hypothetical protein Q8J69_07715 [Sphingobacteriaceae bacterium]|nr:hypothetical protein [Sphingobacteriaceae bacterium]